MRLRWGIEDCGVMSDLCMYEPEDDVWDDHIVPHSGYEFEDQFGVQGYSRKKLRHGLIGFLANAVNATKDTIQRKEEINLPTLTEKDIMLEKGSLSHAPDGTLHTSCNGSSIKEVASMASEMRRMSNNCLENENIDSVGSELCADDSVLDEKCAEVDDNIYRYPLHHISQTDNINFLDNDCQGKERTDLIYCEWPDDIGNFEDVDRMFRSCDSTFGLGSLNDEDDLCWFSSSHSAQGSEAAVRLGSKFSSSDTSALNSVSEYNEASRLNNASHLVDDSTKKNQSIGDKISSRASGAIDHSDADHLSYHNGSDTKPTDRQKKQARFQNQSEGKMEDVNLENGHVLHHRGNLKQFADMNHASVDSSHQVSSLPGVHPHEQNMLSNSFSHMQSNVPYINMDDSSSEKISICPTPDSKSENNDHSSSSPKESSFASNLVHSTESSRGPQFEAPTLITNEKREGLSHCPDLQYSSARSFNHINMASPMTFYDSVQKQTNHSEYEIEGHSENEVVSMGIHAEINSATGQENFCVSSVLDEISLEATSFCQLQQVMEKLDNRMKLCIRDSLYRLARSAEQRLNCVTVNTNSGKRENRDANGTLMAEETNKNTGFMDVETDTNPIDRSVAHLLFHRPSDPSLLSRNDDLSLNSHPIMIHGSVTSPREQVCQEETATGADQKFAK